MIDPTPWLGIPYLDGGRDPKVGLDCWGAVRAVLASRGIDVPEYAGSYSSSEEEREVAALVAREADSGRFRKVDASERQPGDLIRMRWLRSEPSHVAVYLGGHDFLHAQRGGVCVQSLLEDPWKSRVVDYWRAEPPNLPATVPTWSLAAKASPITDEVTHVDAPVGSTLFDGLMAAGVKRHRDGGYVRVLWNGVDVPKEWWPRLRPRAGQSVTAISIPGPPVFAYFAVYGAYFATAFKVAALALSVASTVYSITSANSSPARKSPKGPTGPGQSPQANGTGNQLVRWGKCSSGYGTMRITPPLAAPAYTELLGIDKYWRMLLEVGLGEYEVSGIQVGGVPIEQIHNYSYTVYAPGDDNATLPEGNPQEVPINATIEYARASSEWEYGNWITREIPGEIDEIAWEIFFPGGLFRVSTAGRKNAVNIGIDVEYKLKTSGTWLKAASASGLTSSGDYANWGVYVANRAWNSGTIETFYGSNPPVAAPDGIGTSCIVLQGGSGNSFIKGWTFPTTRGEYEVRYRTFPMMTASFRSGGADTAAFIADHELLLFRGIKYHATPVRGAAKERLTLVGIRVPVKETGSTAGQVSLIRTRKLKAYDPLDPDADVNGMAPASTANGDNPVWAALDMCCGDHFATRPIAYSKFNLAQLADVATRAKPCHLEIDYATNVWDCAQMALSGSFMSLGYSGGKWTVVEDKSGQTARALVTPRNGASWKGTKQFPDIAHALRVSFLDEEKEWQESEALVFDDGYDEGTATKYEQIDAHGITNRTNAIEFGKRHLRAVRLRSEEWTVTMSLDALVSKRGDVVRANIPMALVGQKSARVIELEVNGSGNATAVLLDENVSYAVGGSYGCRYRIVDPGDSTRFALVSADVTNPATVDTVEQNRVTFTSPILVATGLPAVGSLFTFGERNEETLECLVREVQRRGYEADVTLIPYAPTIFNAVDEAAVFAPIVSDPVPLPQLRAPKPPAIFRVLSDERFAYRTPEGVVSRMVVYVRPRPGGRGEPAFAMVRIGERTGQLAITEADWRYSDWTPIDQTVTFDNVEDGHTYEVQARAITREGVSSDWGVPIQHTITWGAAPPPDVTEARVEGDEMRWTYPYVPLDFDGFLVRYRIGWDYHATWDDCIAAHPGVWRAQYFPISNFPREDGNLTLLVRAVDLRGTLSTNAARVVLPYRPDTYNVVELFDERSLGWPGTKTDCAVSGGDLLADQEDGTDDQPMWRRDAARMWSPSDATVMWNNPHSKEATYLVGWTPEEHQLGRAFRWVQNDFEPAHLVLWKQWQEKGPGPMWTVDDSPMWSDDAAAIWTGWSELRPWTGPLEHPVRKPYRFITTLKALARAQSKLTQEKFLSDVEDRRETYNDVAISAAGSRIPLTSNYNRIDMVGITIQAVTGETAYTYRVADKQPYGPLIQLFDITGTQVAGTVDAEVVGY